MRKYCLFHMWSKSKYIHSWILFDDEIEEGSEGYDNYGFDTKEVYGERTDIIKKCLRCGKVKKRETFI